MDNDYKNRVDVLWNFQPVPGNVNNYKRARHPQEFFKGDGKKYLGDYDYLPELGSDRWVNERKFIRYRHKKMRRELLTRYELRLKRGRAKMDK